MIDNIGFYKGKFFKWISSVDNRLLIGVFSLILIGVLAAISSYPIVGERLHNNSLSFIKKFVVYVFASISIMIFLSTQSKNRLKTFAVLGFCGCLFLIFLTPIIGSAHKGSVRWIHLGFLNLQPTEIFKPFFIMFISMLIVKLKENYEKGDLNLFKKNLAFISVLFISICALIFKQPDMGMLVTYIVVFTAIIFIAGFPWKWLVLLGGAFVMLLVSAYFIHPHFEKRIDQFLNPAVNDTYQIDRAINTIEKAGMLGSTDNYLKNSVPDIHTDFVFISLFEDFGVFSLILVLIIFLICVRILEIIKHKKDPFVIYSCFGFMALFFFQSFVNIASTLRLIPTKGMTLPFVSYGGSSYLGFAIMFGFLLALSRDEGYE